MVLNRAVLARWNRMLSKQANGCWLATSTNTADGYARWRPSPGEREVYVHRWAYEAFVGPIPDGMQVSHECHDRAEQAGECVGGVDCHHRRCCNPQHLGLQTPSENTLVQHHFNRNKDSCPAGHPLSGQNLVVWKDGKRRCRKCLRNRK